MPGIEYSSQATIIIFLVAGAFAFASAVFIKELLKYNSKKLTKNLIKADKTRQKKIIRSIKGLFLGKDGISKKEYKTYKNTTQTLTRELNNLSNKFKKKSTKTVEKEFEKHQSIAFSFGLFTIGYLVLMMLFTIEQLTEVNILVVYISLYFFYLSYILFGILIPIFITFMFFIYGSSLSYSEKFLITEFFLFYFIILFYSIKRGYFGILKKFSVLILNIIYMNVVSKNTKNVLIKIKTNHYENLINYTIHFIAILLFIFITFKSKNIFGYNLLESELNYLGVDLNKSTYKALLCIMCVYFFAIIMYPALRLNIVYHIQIKKYISNRDKIWEKEEYIELMELKERHGKYISLLNSIEENLKNKFKS